MPNFSSISIVPRYQENFRELVMNISNLNTHVQISIEKRTKIIAGLVPFAIKEPLIPLNETSKPKITISMECSDYPFALGSEFCPNETKIAHMIQYGFETDILEILLNEVYDYVDKFFITEANVAHFKSIIKPLV